MDEQQERSGGMGYSDRISDSVFAQPEVKAKGNLKYMLFVVPLVVLVLLWRSGVLGTLVFALLLGVTVVLALPPLLRERRAAEDVTFDGTVESVIRREPVTDANVARVSASTRDKMILNTIKIRDDAGKVHTYERMGGLGGDYRAYYHPGDRVRHHRGFDLPEKYDKSADADVICIVCGHINSMDSRRCTACSAALLK